MQPLSVLIVDDSKIVVGRLSGMLKELGHTIAGTAANGAEAVRKYRELNPDLVTMDITMPQVNGIDATKEILAENPDAVVIVITSHGQEQMVIDAVEAGARGYVLKPFKKENIEEQIRSAMHRPAVTV